MEEPKKIPARKVKSRRWSNTEIEILVKSWKDNYHLKRRAKHKPRYLLNSAIRKDLLQHGYDRSLKEIACKAAFLLKTYRLEKESVLENGCLEIFPFFFDLVDIEKMKLETDSIDNKSKVDPSVPFHERGEKNIQEGNDLECAQVIENNLQNDSLVSDSAFQSCSSDNHSGEKEPDEDVSKDGSPSVNNQHPPSDDLQTTTEHVLLSFCKAFRKAHLQLKRNDLTLLGLFREQNEIFKTQMTLIEKLVPPD